MTVELSDADWDEITVLIRQLTARETRKTWFSKLDCRFCADALSAVLAPLPRRVGLEFKFILILHNLHKSPYNPD